MPKITSVEPQKKNPHRFNIFLDGQFAFGADEDLVVDFRLIPGKEITKENLDKIIFEAEVGKLMERMYRYFGIRMRSEKEVRDYLKQLSFKRKIKDQEELTEVVIERLIEKLKQKEMLNDLEFAKAWASSRRLSKKKGIQSIKSELYQKGIDKDLIEEVLASQSNEVTDETLATQALEKKLRSWKGLSAVEFKKKAYDFLGRRGFGYDVIRDVVEKISKSEYNTDSSLDD